MTTTEEGKAYAAMLTDKWNMASWASPDQIELIRATITQGYLEGYGEALKYVQQAVFSK